MQNNDIEIVIPKGTTRKSGTLTFSNGGGGVVALTVNWSSTPDTSSNSSVISATMTIYANAEGSALNGSYLSINGNSKSYNTYISTSGNSAVTHTLVSHSVTVPHNSDGTKTITISGCLVWNGYMWNGSSITFDSISGSGNVTLDTIIVGTPPYNPRVSLDKTGTVEGRVTVSAGYDCDRPYGTVYYNYGRSTDGTNWVESGWITSSTAGYTITDIQRGATHRFRVKVKNGKGETGWSGIATVKANSIPSQATNLAVSSTRPINSVNLSWQASTDADGHAIKYKIYISKNDGSWQYLNETSSTSLSYNISSDAQGTKYKFKVEAYDTFNVFSTSGNSGEFIKATQPTNQAISLNKSGIIEGSITATGSHTCAYPGGTAQYQFAYYYDGISWQERSWTTSNTFTIDTASARGKNWYFKVRVKNDVGTSDWSAVSSVKSNSIPTAATSLSHSPKYPIDSITLKWSAASDIDNHAITYKVYLSKNNGAWSLIATTSETTCTYNNSVDASETKYKFKVEAYDTFNVFSTSSDSAEFFKPTPPSVPAITSPSDNIYENDFSIKWNASNFYKLTGYYVSQKKVNSGEWVELSPNSTSTTVAFSINSLNRGDTVQFRIKAINEAGQESSWSTITTTKRNRIPTAATNILPTTRYLLDLIDFSWTASTDPDGHSVVYNLYLSKNDGEYTSLGEVSKTTYRWLIPPTDLGETTYRLKIITEDSLGAMTEAIGPIIKKPTPPSNPSALKPADGYYEGSINFSWNHSNWYGQTGNYILEIYVDGALNKTVTVEHNISNYSYSLSEIPRGSTISYKIRAKNSFNQMSDWESSTAKMYHNRIPGAPQIVLPITSKTLYSKNPKIVLKTGIDLDNQKMTMHVKYNGSIYNSLDHSQYFSKTTLGNNEYIIFKHTNNLIVGDNTIEAYVNDGLINSSKVSSIIKVVNIIPDVASEALITATAHNNRVDALEKTREAYGLESSGITKVTAGKSAINSKYVTDFINKLNELTTSIDRYHENNKFKYSFTYSNPTQNSTIINKSHYNQISNVINSI